MRVDSLPGPTRELFEYASGCEELAPFVLVGGSALSLQIGHRQSLDLDFAVHGHSLPARAIDRWIERVRRAGVAADNVTDIEAASRFRINTGLSLERYVRDYEVAGVRVTFFVQGRNDVQRHYYRQSERLQSPARSFPVMGMAGLKVSKTLLLADRVRSRDLFDLMVLMRDHGWRIDDVAEVVRNLGHNNDLEHYLAVMSGDIPLDPDDEGLRVTGAAISIDDIYAELRRLIDDWQIRRASEADW